MGGVIDEDLLLMARHMSAYTIKASLEIKREAMVILDHLDKTYK